MYLLTRYYCMNCTSINNPCDHAMYAYQYIVTVPCRWTRTLQKLAYLAKSIFKKYLPICQDTFRKYLEDTSTIFKITTLQITNHSFIQYMLIIYINMFIDVLNRTIGKLVEFTLSETAGI